VVDGKTDVREPKPPIPWPDPLRIEGTDEAILDLGTRVVPSTLDVLIYEKVGPDGVPNEDPVKVLMCQSGRLVPGRLGSDSGVCPVPGDGDQENGNGRFVVPSSSWQGGRYFLVVSASWHVEVDRNAEGPARTPTHDAAWIFSLQVDGQ